MARKKFEITKPESKFEIKWHQQLNANDCGPMVIMNLMISDGKLGPTSVGEIRHQVSNDGWFLSSQVADYLRLQGYRTELMSDRINIGRAKQELHEGGATYIAANGHHFKAIKSTGDGRYVLLDSLLDGPREINRTEVDRMLDASVGTTGILITHRYI